MLHLDGAHRSTLLMHTGLLMTQAFFFRPDIERQRVKNDRKCYEDQTAAVYIANCNANHISIGQMVS